MANAKRNKKYKPRPIVANPIQYMIGGLKRIDGEHLTNLNVKNHAALLAIVQGRGTRDDWDLVAGAINMAIVMSECGTGEEYRDALIEGQNALLSCGVRYGKINKFVLTGDELKALNLAMEVHDAQLEISRVIDVERATNEVFRRLKHNINTKRVSEAA